MKCDNILNYYWSNVLGVAQFVGEGVVVFKIIEENTSVPHTTTQRKKSTIGDEFIV